MANPYDPIEDDRDPVDDDQPPYFPVADPDAPMRPDWDGVEPEGDQQPDAEVGDDE